MKKVFSNSIALTVLAATMAIQTHAEVVVTEPQTPLTLEEQVQQNTTNIQTNLDDIITNVYLNHENAVGIERNANDIADINQRLNNSTPGSTPSADYRGFTTPFAAAGQPKNVIVLRRDNADGSTYYRVRTRYENSENETVTINGSDRIYNYLAVYGNINFNSGGQLTSVNRYIEAMDDTSYTDYSRSTKIYDPSTLELSSVSTFNSEVVDIFTTPGPMRIIRRYITEYNAGSQKSTSNMLSRFYSLSIGYQANGIDFGTTPIRIEQRPEGGSRIRAKGIGVVEFFGNGHSDSSRVIYYNVNGQTGGSLTGTPFETNSNLYNLFF